MAGQRSPGPIFGATAPSLVRWGLSADADLVYRCLLGSGPRSARQIAVDLGFPIKRLRAALEELDSVAIVSAGSGRGNDERLWRAVAVDHAVTLVRRRRARLVSPSAAGHARLSGPPGLAALVGSTRSGPIGRLHLDRHAIRARIGELAAAENVEHLAMHPEPAFTSEVLSVATPLDIALLQRGVAMYTLGRPPIDGDASTHHVDPLHELGCRYRESPEVPHKIMIFDRRVAMVALDPAHVADGALEVTEPNAVASLVALFLRRWAEAVDPRPKGVPPVVLTSREKSVVALLAQGLTDEAAARQLGLSTRSITYTLRGLMDRLGVENRFQLGVALGAMKAVALPPLPPETESHGDEGRTS